MMGTDEKIAILARAILALAERSAHTWDYDGETMVGEGVQLPFDIEETLRALSALTAGKPEQPETVESVLLDAVRKIASTDLSGCANMTTAEIFGALSRMHETARVAVETAERILGRE